VRSTATPIDFVQREQASERSLWRFLENRPRPRGVVHNVTKKHWRAFFDFGGFSLSFRKGLEVVLRTIHCNVCPFTLSSKPRPMAVVLYSAKAPDSVGGHYGVKTIWAKHGRG
jgi:hypothetical protein